MRTNWWSRRALGLHAALLVTVPACAFACWWQASRALSGNDLSWVYTFEWPFFACYAAYMWWRLVHERPPALPSTSKARSAPAAAAAGTPTAAMSASAEAEPLSRETLVPEAVGFDPYDDEADPELAAYNRYLTELNASGKRKTW